MMALVVGEESTQGMQLPNIQQEAPEMPSSVLSRDCEDLATKVISFVRVVGAITLACLVIRTLTFGLMSDSLNLAGGEKVTDKSIERTVKLWSDSLFTFFAIMYLFASTRVLEVLNVAKAFSMKMMMGD